MLQSTAKSYWCAPPYSCIAAALGRKSVLRVDGFRRLSWQQPRSSMKIHVGFEITYDFVARTPMMLMLNVHPSRAADIIKPDQLRVSPAVPFTRYRDAFGNVRTRLVAPPGELDIRTDALVADSGIAGRGRAGRTPARSRPSCRETLQFLLPSRYCEAERAARLAWSRFGSTPPGGAGAGDLRLRARASDLQLQARARRPRRRSTAIASAGASAAISRIWRSRCAAA